MYILCVLSGLCATLIMTSISYILSYLTNNNFKEPELLQFLIFNRTERFLPRIKFAIGWSIHLLIGCVLSTTIVLLWVSKLWTPTLLHALIVGLFIGMAAVLAWHIGITSSKVRLATNLIAYYSQLIFVHGIFSIVVTIIYNYWV